MLSDSEIDLLAREIVRQVRLRGPFVSMSQFVNRSLAEYSTAQEVTRSGALQAALDETVNIDIDASNQPFVDVVPLIDRATFAFNGDAPVADVVTGNVGNGSLPNGGSEQDWAITGSDRSYKSTASILSERQIASSTNNELGFRSTSIPAWVNQADILQLLGPSMNVRSDTFTIRTCGRAHDANGNIIAEAYAEAVVQRSMDFVDPSNASADMINQLTDTNERFGRRFDIVSFRWLRENEI